jgi:hypothetical protein
VIRVREEAPPLRSGEQVVARPGVSDYLPIRVERIPVSRGEDRVLAELANVERDPLPILNVRRCAVSTDGRASSASLAEYLRRCECIVEVVDRRVIAVTAGRDHSLRPMRRPSSRAT